MTLPTGSRLHRHPPHTNTGDDAHRTHAPADGVPYADPHIHTNPDRDAHAYAHTHANLTGDESTHTDSGGAL